MANYCSNCIIIEGENVPLVVEWLNSNLREENRPEYLSDLDLCSKQEKLARDPYRSIGSRWIEFGEIEVDEQGAINMVFESAWSPINPLLKKIAKKWKVCVTNYYEEGGNGVGGKYTYDPHKREEFIDDCGYELYREKYD